ncbi:MAG: hypothetical protein K2X98_00415 [Alphaproteobacteria bacterium]|nr:hypothetical protein [Alphaproteobacteria bacterium]
MFLKHVILMSLCSLGVLYLTSGISFSAEDMDIDELRVQKKYYETLWLKERVKRKAAEKKHHHYKKKCNKLMVDNEKLYCHYRKKNPRHHPLDTYVPSPLPRIEPQAQPLPQAISQALPQKATVESIDYSDVQNGVRRPVFDHWMYNDH